MKRVLAYSGESLRDFAKRTGIPYRTLQDYAAEKRAPGADHLRRIAEAGIDVHWLLTGKFRPPVRLDYDSEDWPDIAEKIGAQSKEMIGELFDLSLDLAEGFRSRYLERHGKSLSVREAFSVFSVYYWLVLRAASRVIPLVTATTKAPPRWKDVRSLVTATVTPELDARVESHLARLL